MYNFSDLNKKLVPELRDLCLSMQIEGVEKLKKHDLRYYTA